MHYYLCWDCQGAQIHCTGLCCRNVLPIKPHVQLMHCVFPLAMTKAVSCVHGKEYTSRAQAAPHSTTEHSNLFRQHKSPLTDHILIDEYAYMHSTTTMTLHYTTARTSPMAEAEADNSVLHVNWMCSPITVHAVNSYPYCDTVI